MQELLKYHLLFCHSKGSPLLSWLGVSNPAHLKACNLFARLGEVPAYRNLHQGFVVEQPKTVSQKVIHSIDQFLMEAQGRNYFVVAEMLYLCAEFLDKKLLKWGFSFH